MALKLLDTHRSSSATRPASPERAAPHSQSASQAPPTPMAWRYSMRLAFRAPRAQDSHATGGTIQGSSLLRLHCCNSLLRRPPACHHPPLPAPVHIPVPVSVPAVCLLTVGCQVRLLLKPTLRATGHIPQSCSVSHCRPSVVGQSRSPPRIMHVERGTHRRSQLACAIAACAHTALVHAFITVSSRSRKPASSRARAKMRCGRRRSACSV